METEDTTPALGHAHVTLARVKDLVTRLADEPRSSYTHAMRNELLTRSEQG